MTERLKWSDLIGLTIESIELQKRVTLTGEVVIIIGEDGMIWTEDGSLIAEDLRPDVFEAANERLKLRQRQKS